MYTLKAYLKRGVENSPIVGGLVVARVLVFESFRRYPGILPALKSIDSNYGAEQGETTKYQDCKQ